MVRRIAGEPETEIFVRVVRGDHLFTDLLQFGHPAGGQVTVLKHDPRPPLDGAGDHVRCYRALYRGESVGSLAHISIHRRVRFDPNPNPSPTAKQAQSTLN